MEKYKCIQSFETISTGLVKKNSIWEYDSAYFGHLEVRLYKENVDDGGEYIDLLHEYFYKYFQRIS